LADKKLSKDGIKKSMTLEDRLIQEKQDINERKEAMRIK
jgi:hypothetical protein